MTKQQMDSTSKNTLRTLLVLIIIITSFVGYTFIKNNFQENNVDLTKSVVWNTYTHEEFAWSLDYPDTWYVYDKGFFYTDENGEEKAYTADGSVLFSPRPFDDKIPSGSLLLLDGISISFEPTPKSYKDVLADSRDLVGFKSEKSTKVDGRKATKMIFDTRNLDNLPNLSQSVSIVYFVDYPKDEFTTLVISLSEKTTDEPKEELLDLILEKLTLPN